MPPFKLSLSLGDERVILAHRTLVRNADASAAPQHATAARRSTSCCPPTGRRARSRTWSPRCRPTAADRALLIDDASPDETTHGRAALRPRRARATPSNRGYGASQKTGYVRALRDGAEVIVMVHADNQYDPGLVAEMAAPILAGEADIVIGSRLLDDRAIAGGMPRWKWLGNRLLTGIENRAFGVRFSEYHTGYRAFCGRLPALDPVPAQLRRLRLRPGDLRPDARAQGARAGDPDPDPLLPRGVLGRLRDEPALRVQDAVRARALPARPPLGAAAPARRMDRPCGRSGRDPGRRAGDPRGRGCSRRRTTSSSTTRSTTTATRRRSRPATGFATSYGRPTAFRPPLYPIFLAGVYWSSAQARTGWTGRGSRTRSSAPGSWR